MIASGPLCLVDELRRVLPHHPTSSRRQDVGPRGADLVDEDPWHLVLTDLGHVKRFRTIKHAEKCITGRSAVDGSRRRIVPQTGPDGSTAIGKLVLN
jgi:hypothetical protein